MDPKKQHTKGQRGAGTTQNERMLPALAPDFVQIDEKTEAERLHFALEFSGLLEYYNYNDDADGNWQALLESDPAISISSISAVDLTGFPKQYRTLIKSYKKLTFPPDQQQVLAELYQLNVEVGKLLKNWVGRIKQIDGDSENDAIVQSFDEIVLANIYVGFPIWKYCYDAMFRVFDYNPSSMVKQDLMGDTLKIEKVVLPILGEVSVDDLQKQIPLGTLEDQYHFLQKIFQSLNRTVIQIQKTAPKFLADSLNTPDHQPHNALLLAFYDLLAEPTQLLNGFTQKHLDFYYKQVLQLGLNPPIPDEVLMYFELKQGAKTTLIPQGTDLVAGTTAKGEKILYATANDLFVNSTVVSEYKTVYNGGISSALSANHKLYAAPKANSANGAGGKFPKGQSAWPTLGEEQSGLTLPTMEVAQVGLVIGDPVLYMTEGNRVLNLYVKVQSTDFADLVSFLKSFAKADQGAGQVFSEILGKSFLVSYTGPKGWVEIPLDEPATLFSPDYPDPLMWETDPGAMGFRIQVNIPSARPAVDEYASKVHGPGFQAGMPLLKLALDQSQVTGKYYTPPGSQTLQPVELSPYNLLSPLQLTGFFFQVQVSDKSDMMFQSGNSKLSLKKAFHPFGTRPEQGSSFYIGSTEVFQKSLTDLSFSIGWKDLPVDPNGFSDYYEVYNKALPDTPFENSSFKVEMSLLNNFEWYPVLRTPSGIETEIQSDFQLFEWDTATATLPKTVSPLTFKPVDWLLDNLVEVFPGDENPADEVPAFLQAEGKLLPSTSFTYLDLDQCDLDFSNAPAGAAPKGFGFTPETGNGFLKVTLSAPATGFGYTLYQTVLNFAINKSMSNMQELKSKVSEIPKLPFAPKAKTVSLNYTATAEINIGATHNTGSLYYLQPFGITPVDLSSETVQVLPRYAAEGTLYMGLKKVAAPQLVTLLFQIDENSGNTDLTPPEIEWAWLNGGTWNIFPKSQIASDGTNGFLRSGIVVLSIENDSPSGGGWFDSVKNADELFWIRASAKENASAVCSLITVDTNAVAATYQVGTDAAKHLKAPLAAGTITKLKQNITGVGKIKQPMPSFGGRVPEDGHAFYTRVAERLRHKQRAVTQWDLERITLQAFPRVGLAKCVNHADDENLIAPGNSTLVVFPAVLPTSLVNRFAPKLDQNLLEEIRTTMGALIPESMTLTVRNPEYEYIRVFAEVTVKPGLDPGYYLTQLNQALSNYIAPWTQDPTQHNPYRNTLSRALIYQFIKEQEYLAAVDQFRVEHFRNLAAPAYYSLPGEFDNIQTQKPWGILTSVQKHFLFNEGTKIEDPDLPLGMMIRSNPASKQAPTPPAISKSSKKTTKPPNSLVILPDMDKV